MTKPTQTLAEIVTTNPSAARALDRLGLDYCCNGGRTLATACEDAGLDLTEVAAAIDRVEPSGDTSWTALDLPGLVDHLLETHHAYLHDELPALHALAVKVRDVHRSRHPELDEVVAVVRAIRAELEPHLQKEERVLFPALRALAAGRRDFPFGSIENPIRVMATEHDNAGALLARLRAVTDGFTVPPDGCASFTSLYERLEALELDTHLHVHKENHALFPTAIALLSAPADAPAST